MINKKTLFGYNEEDVKQHLRNLEKDYTQKVAAKRKKLRDILDKNNKLKNQIDLVSNETNKIMMLNRTHSNGINVFIQEIKEAEDNLNYIKQQEERKKLNHYTRLKQKVKDYKDYCNALNSSMEELTAIIRKNKANPSVDQ